MLSKVKCIVQVRIFPWVLDPIFPTNGIQKKSEEVLFLLWTLPFLGLPDSSVGKESACSAGDLGLIPGSGRSLGEGNGNPLQYSCLENPTDRGAWRATVHVFTKSWTQLSSPTRVREPFLFHCSQRHRSYPNSFFVFSLILFCPSWLHGDLSCDFD